MQGQVAVSTGQGQGSVSDIEQCEGGPEKTWSRMVENQVYITPL